MNPNSFFKKSTMLIVILILCNPLIAQDKISLTWRSSHGNYPPSGAYLFIKVTDGELFKIDWGDGTPIEIKTGLGNIDIPLMHYYYYGDEKNPTVTIIASNSDCKFIYFDCHTFFEDDAVSFQIDSLTFEGCSDLAYLYCDYNSLQLSDLYAAQLIIKEQSGRLFGTQFLPYYPLTGGMTVDFSAQRMFGGVETFFSVTKNGKQAIFNVDYTIDNGIITFINDGDYTVTMTNGAIISHPNYPAKVVAGVDLTSVSILENSLSNIKIYPNPTSNIIYLQTESASIPEVKIYSLDGRLLQQIRNTEIDLSCYSVGVYLLSIDGQSVKIIKK